MSTNKTNQPSDEMRDPTDDKYLELEKRLGSVEDAVAAGVAEANKSSEDAMEAAHEHTNSAIRNIRRSRGDGRG